MLLTIKSKGAHVGGFYDDAIGNTHGYQIVVLDWIP